MDSKTIRPSGWYYGLAVLFSSGAVAAVVVIVIAVKRRQSKRA